MAHFFLPKDPGKVQTDFFHVAAKQTVYARLWNSGGPNLKIVSDDASTAEILTPKQVGNGVWEFGIRGQKPGNSLIRAKNDQGHQWAMTQAVVAAPADKGGTGSIYPTAPNAWKGSITFLPVVKTELPPTQNCGDSAHHYSVKFELLGQPLEYVLIPHCVGALPNCQVMYYVAWNKRDQMTEYAIGPGSARAFIDNAAKYFVLAGSWFMFNSSKYQIASSKAVYHMNEAVAQWSLDELKACAKTLGIAWFEAVKDPGWWAQVIPAHVALAAPKPVPVVNGAAPAETAVVAAADGAAEAAAAPKGGTGGLRQGKDIFPRPKGFQKGENIIKGGTPEVGPPKPTPQAMEAMRASSKLPPQEMRAFVEGTLEKSQALKSLANGNPELALQQFQAETGIQVEKVAEGAIQKLRPAGAGAEPDLASMRTRPGYLQIEEQVFKDPKLLKKTLGHDMTYGYVRGSGKNIPKLTTHPGISAADLLEQMVENGGKMPGAVDRLLTPAAAPPP